jgi:hypothetical protein
VECVCVCVCAECFTWYCLETSLRRNYLRKSSGQLRSKFEAIWAGSGRWSFRLREDPAVRTFPACWPVLKEASRTAAKKARHRVGGKNSVWGGGVKWPPSISQPIEELKLLKEMRCYLSFALKNVWYNFFL